MIQLAPSILSADFANLASEIDLVHKGGACALHIDVMDGHFVPNITIGPAVVKSIKKATKLPLDVHLMIENPERYIQKFIDAGADLLSVHIETCPHIHRTLDLIKQTGTKAGVVLNPGTPLGSIAEILSEVDFILIMSVNPGFGGQSFIPASIDKINRLANVLRSRDIKATIAVDGGVCEENIRELVLAGARLIVAGSSVFNSPDPANAVERLLAAANLLNDE